MTTVTRQPNAGPAHTTPSRTQRKRKNAAARLWEASPLTYVGLIIAVVLSAFPILWSFIIATRTSDDVFSVPPPFLPGGNFGNNLDRLLDNNDAAFMIGLTNSIFVSSVVTISVVFFSTLAGFAFAKLRFRGSNTLLLGIILTMMVPTQLGYIPLFMLMVKLDWIGDIQSVIVPFLVSGFGVFMMRQYAMSAISDELIEAARVDGCSTFRIYWSVVMPALRPAAAVLGLLTFMQTWNEFLWPYLVLNNKTPTVQVSLKLLASGYYTSDYAQVFTGTAMALVPLILVFILFGKQIIGGIMEGSVKA